MNTHLYDLMVDFLDKNLQKKIDISVVGDVMFDEYYEVEVERISPEFPIPVYKSQTFDPVSGIIPGGAANVAYQFSNFNIDCQLVGLLNKNAEMAFNSHGINTEKCRVLSNCLVPTKRRIYSHDLPLVRHDIEKENYGLDDIKKHLCDLIVPEADFTIFSDYSKGLFSFPWFRKFILQNRNIVDPKNSFIDMWEGCTYFKPNQKEAEKLSDRKNVTDQLEFFIDALKCDGVLITQSGNGVVGKDKQGHEFAVRPEAKIGNPASVIGAGDCFIGFVSMALAHGFSLEKAAQIAFVAGCCYVQKKHNSPLCPAELFLFTGRKEIRNPEILKNRNFDLVFANGCFDNGLTEAHVACLEFAKKQGGKLVVALNSDSSVTKLKGAGRPVMSLQERMKVVAGLGCVDFVVSFDEETPLEILRKIMPEKIVKGGDYKPEQVVGKELAEVIIFKKIDCMSTTDKIKKIRTSN